MLVLLKKVVLVMDSFAIVVDSSIDLPEESIRALGIDVLPMPFELDGKPHNQGYWQEISDKEYYDALRNGGVAKTSMVNQGTFAAAYKSYAEQGRDALFIVLSSGLSATADHAEKALQDTKKDYPDCGLYLVDGINATIGHGLLALLAAERRSEGLSAGETAAWLEEHKHYCYALFTVDDLMYLHRGGRLSKISAIAGSALGIKPVLNILPDGTLKLKDKVRGRKAALRLLISQLKRSLAPGAVLDRAFISHTDCLEDAQTLAGMIGEAYPSCDVTVMMMGPVIGAHVGPGALTLIFKADITRAEYEKQFYGGE